MINKRKNNYQRFSKLRHILSEYREPHLRRLILTDSSLWGRMSTDGIPPFILPKLSEWMPCPKAEYAWMRIIKGGDPNNVNDRRVFVEKTPRVYDPTVLVPPSDSRAWIEGPKGECSDPKYRVWADNFAEALGYDGDFAEEIFEEL